MANSTEEAGNDAKDLLVDISDNEDSIDGMLNSDAIIEFADSSEKEDNIQIDEFAEEIEIKEGIHDRKQSDDDKEIRSILGQFSEGINQEDEIGEKLEKSHTKESIVSAKLRDQGNPPPPEPDVPFEFSKFLNQLKQKSADPVVRYMKSFIYEFGKRAWTVNEQVKIVHDFLHFICGKMQQCEVWRDISPQELDNAFEGMEKLVMNRLYTQTFPPAVFASSSALNSSAKSNNPVLKYQRIKGGSLSDDLERDRILSQRIQIFKWVEEKHLDITVSRLNPNFLSLAKQEFRKINNYRAPRDKVICILNCCKVIFGLLRHAGAEESADQFIPLLIYVVIQSNVRFLYSNIQYIQRFRNPEKLKGEAGYYLSSLVCN